MFDWIVQRANDAMRPPGDIQNSRMIGILDIFGFEIFEKNRFDFDRKFVLCVFLSVNLDLTHTCVLFP